MMLLHLIRETPDNVKLALHDMGAYIHRMPIYSVLYEFIREESTLTTNQAVKLKS